MAPAVDAPAVDKGGDQGREVTAMTAITRERAGALAAAGAIHLGLIYLLMTGLGIDVPAKLDAAMQLIEVGPPPPPPSQILPPPRPSKRPEGAAAPPNKRAKASDIYAPPPPIPPPVPPPITAAPTPGRGTEASAGAAEMAGPGTGGGGTGNGTGSGGTGSGDGGGDADETPPRLIKGRLKASDYPRGLAEVGISGLVSVRYLVDESGRVARCAVTRSSGSAVLDDTTCRLIQQRFRFEPSRDARGNAVAATIVEDHEWVARYDDSGERR